MTDQHYFCAHGLPSGQGYWQCERAKGYAAGVEAAARVLDAEAGTLPDFPCLQGPRRPGAIKARLLRLAAAIRALAAK